MRLSSVADSMRTSVGRFLTGNQIGRNSLFAVLLISGIVTCAVSAIQLYVEYDRDLKGVQSQLALIGNTRLRAITTATWNFDTALVAIQLQDLIKIPDIVYARVDSPGFSPISAGVKSTGQVIEAHFPLLPDPALSSEKIGDMTVVAGLDNVRARLWQRMGLVMLSQGAKTFITSLFILIFFQIYITRRLNVIAGFAEKLTGKSLQHTGPLRLPAARVFSKSDELDKLAASLEQMRTSLSDELDSNLRMTDRLRESEQRFDMATAAAAVGVWDWNLPDDSMHISRQSKAILGYAMHEIADSAAAWMALVHPEDRPGAEAALQRCLGGQSGGYEVRTRMRHKEGGYHDVLTRGFLMRGDDGAPQRLLGTHVDVTSLLDAQQSVLRLSSAIEQCPVAVAIIDRQGDIVYCNTKLGHLVWRSAGAILGQSLTEVLAPLSSAQRQWQAFWRAVGEDADWREQLPVELTPMEQQWYAASITPIRSADGVVRNRLLIFDDITDRRRHEEQLTFQANYDALTGLPNRSLANERLMRALALAEARRQLVAVMFMDIDNFKVVNDSLGHAAGDALLVQTAQRLRDSVRHGHTVARFSGDEFLIILPNIKDTAQVEEVVARIGEAMREPCIVNGETVFVTFSIGISAYPHDGASPEQLIQHADAAMYEAKRAGRNTHIFFIRSLNHALHERLQMETQLRYAIGRNELCVTYQPIASMLDGRIVGAEALLRWRNPTLGQVCPARFIELAEETGLIVGISRWVLAEVCRDLQRWTRECGFEGSVAVNLSAKDFQGGQLRNYIAQLLKDHGLRPSQLKLEVTERTLLSTSGDVAEALDALAAMGIALSVDDFGTGYSALSYLHKFPFSVIKIDQSFVKDIVIDHQKATLVRGIVSLAHGLDMDVVAEGVETAEHWEMLKLDHCDMAQGWFIAKSMAASDFEVMLTERAGAPVL